MYPSCIDEGVEPETAMTRAMLAGTVAMLMASIGPAGAQSYFARQKLTATSAQPVSTAPKTLSCGAMVMRTVVMQGNGSSVGFVGNAPGWEQKAITKCMASGNALTGCSVQVADEGRLWALFAYTSGNIVPSTPSNTSSILTADEVGVAQCAMR
jgi:hypothetical protein